MDLENVSSSLSIHPHIMNDVLLAQLVEQLTLNQRVLGSSPRQNTSLGSLAQMDRAAVF